MSHRKCTSRRRARSGLVLCVLLIALVAGACSSSSHSSSPSGEPKGQLLVFAATSLTGAFDQIGKQFQQANPGVTVRFNYSGSSTLATQITQAAPADVFASADNQNMTTVVSAKLVKGSPQVFTKNKMEIMVPPGNPKKITSVADLANPAVKVAVCAPAVPCGAYAQEVFKKAGVTVKPVTEEQNVGGVVTKVTLGEVDAGMTYSTDVKAAGSKAEGVVIPPEQNVTADYPLAEITTAPNPTAAAAFIAYVLSPAAQGVLSEFGFVPVSG
jgi:molybdate transport system substrate-binding protein